VGCAATLLVRPHLLFWIDPAKGVRVVLDIALDGVFAFEQEFVAFLDRALRGADTGIVPQIGVARLFPLWMFGRP
jgi:hypothetical protein